MANILIGITGSIAAYKTIELCHLLKKSAHSVKVIITKDALNFVTPISLASFDAEVFHGDEYTAKDALSHINLARWPDLIIIAPLSANTLAKIAGGFADNLLTSTILATLKPVVLVPAMNKHMWHNKITQSNIKKLQELGYKLWGPDSGLQACGDIGDGRMISPTEIMENITHTILCDTQLLIGKNVMITSGATMEAIDPVRYISNHSSGKMGYALARALACHGANVCLVSGITNLETPNNITKFIQVKSSNEMLNACLDNINNVDIFIGCAAVCDYMVDDYSLQKLKKQATLSLNLIKNPDIIATIKEKNPNLFVVGFAAETNNVLEYAVKKIKTKNLDLIVANNVSNNKVFGHEDNEVTIIDKALNITTTKRANKHVIAHQIIEKISINS